MTAESDGQLRVVVNGKEAKGPAHIRRVTQRDAVLRGFKTAGLTVLAALCTIIIPGVHFLSVPGGLIAAPIVLLLGERRMRRGKTQLHASADVNRRELDLLP